MASAQADPELSIVVCTLGVAAVAETVASLRSSAEQASRWVEIVVVWQGDAGSPDFGGGVQVVEAFPLGLSHARNRGLEVARAPFVGFVDDDEVVDSGWVAMALRVFDTEQRPAGVFGPVLPRDDRGLPYCHLEPGEARMFRGASTPPWIIGTGGNMVFDRAELLAAGGFDLLLGVGAEGRAGEDTDVILSLLRRGHGLAWEPELGVYHPTKNAAEHLAARFPYGYGIGRVLRKHGSLAHVARYGLSICDAWRASRVTGDERKRRETAATLRGFLAGMLRPVVWRSPVGALEHAPDQLRARLAGGGWQALPVRTEPSIRLSYRRGDERLVVRVGARDGGGANGAFPGRDSLWFFSASTAPPETS